MIVRLQGGLANQLFQYAFGRCVSRARKEPLLFEKWCLDGGNFRLYCLNAYNINVPLAREVSGPQFIEHDLVFDPRVYTVPNGTHFIGSWQNERYLEPDLIRKELVLKDPVSVKTAEVADQIRSSNSVFLHVRRTDYIRPDNVAFHGGVSMDYYTRAIQHVNERVEDAKFFVFSDDPEWCRANFPNFTVVDHNSRSTAETGQGTEHEDLWLMSQCRHAIFPNSSFGFLGAWLGDEKPEGRIVIGPKRWFATSTHRYDVMPPRWLKLDN